MRVIQPSVDETVNRNRARCRIYYQKNKDKILKNQKKNLSARREYSRKYRQSLAYKTRIQTDEYKARRAEQARKWRRDHQNYDKTNKERSHRYYLKHKDEILKRCKERIKKNNSKREKVVESRKRWYKATMMDPERYAKMLERNRRYRERHKDEINEKKRSYVKAHKRKMKRQWRFSRDKMKIVFRNCPELWALHRKRQRDYFMKWRRLHGVKMTYHPRLANRIPDNCAWGSVIDTRSVFLWNNLPAASLLAGRAFKNLQWRDVHCDRFGEVCR